MSPRRVGASFAHVFCQIANLIEGGHCLFSLVAKPNGAGRARCGCRSFFAVFLPKTCGRALEKLGKRVTLLHSMLNLSCPAPSAGDHGPTMTSTELRAGLLIDGVVRLVGLVGEGGMGSVWVADHLRLGTQVAVKFLSPQLAKESGAIVRFQHEAMSAAQIKSPHVVQVFDHGVFAGQRPYIVMELLEGEDLAQRLERTGPLSLLELARLVVHVCRALRKAHAAGIVHRDIKPGNVFLSDQDGELFAKVLDFGIARRADAPVSTAVTDVGSMVGTPLYMSPEQMIGHANIDFRTDLWSLGVLTYYSLVGRV